MKCCKLQSNLVVIGLSHVQKKLDLYSLQVRLSLRFYGCHHVQIHFPPELFQELHSGQLARLIGSLAGVVGIIVLGEILGEVPELGLPSSM